jgi:two-component system, NarL family, sensor kinase
MTRLALVLWGVSVALSSLGMVVLVLSASTPIPPRFGFRGSDAILAVVLATVGALIAIRRPHNPVGWLFGAAGLIFAATAFAAEYRVYAVLTRRGSLPLGPEAAWVANWSWPLLLGVITGLFLLFPTAGCPRAAGDPCSG